MRLIDADKLFPYGSVPYYQDDGFKTADRIYGIIKNAPTVDALEVVHARWIERKEIFSENEGEVEAVGCSACGKSQRKFRLTPYCPNCGAKMDGDT